MSNLFIEGTKSTPSVDFDGASGRLRLSGASYPENAFGFYKPVLEWAQDYTKALDRPTSIEIDLKYLNTSSTKCLMNFMRLFTQLPRGRELVTVIWFHDRGNDTIIEVAQEFSTGIQLPFRIIEKA
jgi:hypothetical protein